MVEICHCPSALACLFSMAKELVGIGSCTVYFRCLYHQKNPMDMVEEFEK